jgi:hypothetical protein
MSDNSTLPGCVGFYGAPLAPNGPCEKCSYARLCKHVKVNFVAKTKLQPILALLEDLEQKLRR